MGGLQHLRVNNIVNFVLQKIYTIHLHTFIVWLQLLSVNASANSTLSKIKIHFQIFVGGFEHHSVDTIVNSTLQNKNPPLNI